MSERLIISMPPQEGKSSRTTGDTTPSDDEATALTKMHAAADELAAAVDALNESAAQDKSVQRLIEAAGAVTAFVALLDELVATADAADDDDEPEDTQPASAETYAL